MLQVPRAATVPVLAVLLAAGAEECDVEGGPPKACDFRPVVKIDNRIKIAPDRPIIIATATADCVKPPDVHTFSLTLQQQDIDGSWGMGPVDESAKIPRPGNPVKLRVEHGCYPGTWRATARASGKGPTGKPFDFTDITIREVRKGDCRYRQGR